MRGEADFRIGKSLCETPWRLNSPPPAGTSPGVARRPQGTQSALAEASGAECLANPDQRQHLSWERGPASLPQLNSVLGRRGRGKGGQSTPPRGSHQQAGCLHPSPDFANVLAQEASTAFLTGGSFFNLTAFTGAADSVRGTKRKGMKGPCVPEIVPEKTLWLIPGRGLGARETPAGDCVPNLSGHRKPPGDKPWCPSWAFSSLQGLLHHLSQQLPEGRGGGVGSVRESSNLQNSGAAPVSRGSSPRLAPLEGTMHVGPFIVWELGGGSGGSLSFLKETYKFGLTPQLPNQLQTPEALCT